MVTINKIEIENFLGQGNLTWNLDPEVNILGGKNGSGKSTILKVCHDLLSQGGFSNPSAEQYAELFKSFLIKLDNGWTIRWKLIPNIAPIAVGTKEHMVPVPYCNVTSILDENGNMADFSNLKQQLNVFLINSFEQHLSKASKFGKQSESFPLEDPMVLDLLIKDQIDIRNSQFAQAMENYVDSSTPDDASRSSYVQNYKKIYESLSHFLQDYDEPFKGSFEFVRNGQRFGYEHLSMGEKQILLLLLMVSNTNQQPCIFLMDEPDLSMHIDWKEILIKELHTLNPHMQIILTTHAPSVITGWHDRVKEVSQLIQR